MTTPAGWYPDPDDNSRQRYWDGTQWTDDHAAAATPQTPGWYPDPDDPDNRKRYWNGTGWTTHTEPLAKQSWFATNRNGLIAAAVVLGGLFLLAAVNSRGGEDEQPAAEPEVTMPAEAAEEDEATTFKGKVRQIMVVNPATVRFSAMVKNTGDVASSPSCFVMISDVSGTYEGYDSFDLERELAPGDRTVFTGDLTITNEGAAYANRWDIECEDAWAE